jgi:hypothetical protein
MKVDNMYIVENFLDDEEFVDIEKFICGKKTEWTYNPIKSRPETGVVSDDRTYHNQQMVKVYYNPPVVYDMNWLSHFSAINWRFSPLSLLRVKVNMQFPCVEIIQSPFHCDLPKNDIPNDVKVYTAILYLNTNNGYTIFEDTGEKVQSIKNQLLLFNAKRAHAGTSFTNAKNRIVINMNFVPSAKTEEYLQNNSHFFIN